MAGVYCSLQCQVLTNCPQRVEYDQALTGLLSLLLSWPAKLNKRYAHMHICEVGGTVHMPILTCATTL